jgi:hypothetical protein
MEDYVSSKSGYNEASFKMARLDASQKRIGIVNHNLTAFYNDLGDYGYKIKKTEIDNLIGEVWGKLSPETKKTIDTLRKIIDDSLKYKPIFTLLGSGVSQEKPKKLINEDNLDFISSLLFKTHMYVHELLEEAGYTTFDQDQGDDEDPYNT